jgi:CRP-like cAMP-binding protein
MSRQVEHSEISKLVPISSLTYENQAELVRKVSTQDVAAGKMLFKAGQTDKKTIYLLQGELELRTESGELKVIQSGTKEALHPVAHRQPRDVTCIAKKDSVVIAVDNDLMDVLVTWDQTASYIVNDIEEGIEVEEEDNDWMTQILRSEIFQRIPPANIQKMFMRMEQLPVTAGDTIVRQGDKGDYYYILQKGQAEVTRLAPDGQRSIRLAVLNSGDGFGEEALIEETVRNATVKMISDGALMRLSQADFNELLKEPVLSQVKYDEATQLVDNGAVWLDVRLENEHQATCIKGSLNIPLYLLRLRANKLDEGKKYIIYCDTGSRSATAAYLLSQRGFDISVLTGGLASVPKTENAA